MRTQLAKITLATGFESGQKYCEKHQMLFQYENKEPMRKSLGIKAGIGGPNAWCGCPQCFDEAQEQLHKPPPISIARIVKLVGIAIIVFLFIILAIIL